MDEVRHRDTGEGRTDASVMHPALARQKLALTFSDAADYLNKEGLSGGSRVRSSEVLEWAITNDCVSVSLPLLVRARRKDAPAGRVEEIDGLLTLVLDEVGRLEAHRLYLDLAHGSGWTVRVNGKRGATVMRDDVSYELLDPQREDDGILRTMPKAGSALPAHAGLVVSRDALARFIATLSPVAALTEPGKDETRAATTAIEASPKPFRADDYDFGAYGKLPDRQAERERGLANYIANCSLLSGRTVSQNEVCAKLLSNKNRKTIKNWTLGKVADKTHVEILTLLNKGAVKLPPKSS